MPVEIKMKTLEYYVPSEESDDDPTFVMEFDESVSEVDMFGQVAEKLNRAMVKYQHSWFDDLVNADVYTVKNLGNEVIGIAYLIRE